MFELKISNFSRAIQLSQQWATHTVSLLDPDFKENSILPLPETTPERQIRRYYFHDISKLPTSALKERFPNAQIATIEQLKDILEFTAPLQSTDKLLVHCHAGISRSTAVACGILCQHGLTPQEASKLIFSIRPHAFPNQYILSLFDKLFGLDDSLVTTVFHEMRKVDHENMQQSLVTEFF
jgi:predicted protein tyrosine phosphatase